MTITISSQNVPVPDRQEALLDAIYGSVVHVDITHQGDVPPTGIDYELQLSQVGSIVMFSAASSSIIVDRTAQLVDDNAEPQIVVGLQASGSSALVQNGRYAVLEQGEFAIWDTTSPYTLIFDHRVDQHFFRLPRASLALPEASLRELSAVTIRGDRPAARFVASYLSRLADTAELRSSDAGAIVSGPTIDLLRGVLSTELHDSQNSRPALEATLEFRILDYMTRHLAEPDLTARRVAFAHHISIRYLYVILARAGVSPGEWIRTHRLEACRRDLARSGGEHLSIGAVARAWGFADAARFSRMFSTAFGLSPRDWRELNARLA